MCSVQCAHFENTQHNQMLQETSLSSVSVFHSKNVLINPHTLQIWLVGTGYIQRINYYTIKFYIGIIFFYLLHCIRRDEITFCIIMYNFLLLIQIYQSTELCSITLFCLSFVLFSFIFVSVLYLSISNNFVIGHLVC